MATAAVIVDRDSILFGMPGFSVLAPAFGGGAASDSRQRIIPSLLPGRVLHAPRPINTPAA